jgi:L-lactate dehydrogenase complex protein LldF
MSKHTQAENFNLIVSQLTGNTKHQQGYAIKQQKAASQFSNITLAKQHAAGRRWRAIENLDKYLIEFESNIIKTGAKVLWAQSYDAAEAELAAVFKKNYATSVYYDSSNEIRMPFVEKTLEKNEIKQVALSDRTSLTSTVVAQANFIIADPGAIAFISDDTHLQHVFSKARCIIAIASVSDVLTHINDLNLFVPLTASYTHTKKATPLLSLLFGQRKPEETDVPAELYVLLIDDCSTVLADTKARQSIWCIHCQACVNSCPVATAVGTQTPYYQNPVHSIISPINDGFDSNGYLNHTTTLCGSCTEVCPVNIDLNRLFLHNRATQLQQKGGSQKEKWFYLMWKKTMLNRNKYNIGKFSTYSWVMETIINKTWGKSAIPAKPELTFQQMWLGKFQ